MLIQLGCHVAAQAYPEDTENQGDTNTMEEQHPHPTNHIHTIPPLALLHILCVLMRWRKKEPIRGNEFFNNWLSQQKWYVLKTTSLFVFVSKFFQAQNCNEIIMSHRQNKLCETVLKILKKLFQKFFIGILDS